VPYKFCSLLLVSITLVLLAKGQPDTIPVRLSGRVFSSDSLQAAPYVHVINLRTGKGTVAGVDGAFLQLCLGGDSLLFRCMGFDDAIWEVPRNLPSTMAHFDIKIHPGNIELEVIDIIALTRQSQFKYDFIHLKPDKNAWENQFIIPGVTRKQYVWIGENEKINPKSSFTGPVSALYYKYSSEGKSLQKLADLKNNEERQRIIDSKYSMKLLGEFTGYTGDKLIAFFVYLHFTDDYIFETNLYSIYTQISYKTKQFEYTYTEGK
jgi:hypothetical protein